MGESGAFLVMKNISKTFPGVKALDGVTFEVQKGEVHALVGENGAGKSTLIKILSGAYRPDGGEILLRGQRVEINTPGQAQQLGISVIYQELDLIPHMTIPENIFVGREPARALGLVDWREMGKKAQALMASVGMNLPLNIPVRKLSAAQQQMVAIARALSLNADIIVMDEPTASLTQNEIQILFRVIEKLKASGVTIIYISHRLEEIFQIADRVTVLRDGKYIGTWPVGEVGVDHIIRCMVGRDLKEKYPRERVPRGEEILRVEGLTHEPYFRDVSFSLHAGEILGIAGLVGAGRSEIMRSIVGADEKDSGEVYLFGKKVDIKSPHDAIRLGIGLLPEERKLQGLILQLDVRSNISLPILDRLSRWGFIRRLLEYRAVVDIIDRLGIKTPSPEQKVKNLSGGNQQKVVFAKWFLRGCRVFIFDEPTRGIDVGAKLEIYKLMNELVRDGVGIIVISSDLPEVLGISDRLLVMHHGRIAGELRHEEATQEKVLNLAFGGVA
ncbi:MAG TPA: sugar ABC transporter ATP-binding protein [Firmicutes bacterium]|nr:sugar ABC transporter ATP-binding protein [Bacillota bacterium]